MPAIRFIGGPKEGEILHAEKAPPKFYFEAKGPPYVRDSEGITHGRGERYRHIYKRMTWSEKGYYLYRYQGRINL